MTYPEAATVLCDSQLHFEQPVLDSEETPSQRNHGTTAYFNRRRVKTKIGNTLIRRRARSKQLQSATALVYLKAIRLSVEAVFIGQQKGARNSRRHF